MSHYQIRLVSHKAEIPNFEISVERLPVTLGRSKNADVQVLDPLVSRFQCRFEEEGGAVVLKDLQSKNGTLVNGAMIESCPLKAGDILLIGNAEFETQFAN